MCQQGSAAWLSPSPQSPSPKSAVTCLKTDTTSLSSLLQTAEQYTKTDLLAVFLAAAAKPFTERTDEDAVLVSRWMDKLGWYEAFRRAGLKPTFEPEAKRMRV
jgi:hypothetical protein